MLPTISYKIMAILQNNEKIGQYTVQTLIKSNLYTETYKVVGENNIPYFLKLFLLKNIRNKIKQVHQLIYRRM